MSNRVSFYRAVARALKRVAIQVRRDPKVNGVRVNGYYDVDSDLIVISWTVLKRSVEEAVLVVLHEAVHAVGIEARKEYLVDGVLDQIAYRSAALRWLAAKRLLEVVVLGASEPEED